MQHADLATNATSPWLDAIRVYIAGSALLHLTWEILQLPLYTIAKSGSWGEIAFAVVHCTAGDVMIAALTLLAGLIVIGGSAWPGSGRMPVAVAAMALGAGYTIYSEWLNVIVRGNWTYADLMPTLPVLGTGLAPLFQWIIVPTLVLWLAIGRAPWADRDAP